ncbi:hypothetical protein GQ473_07655 [archaeon]|nr:hypothetical protein [archaeon]
MKNITLYGKIGMDIDLDTIFDDCPKKYQFIVTSKPNIFGLIRNDGDEPYTVIIQKSLSDPENEYGDFLTVTGSDSEKVDKIIKKLQGKLCFDCDVETNESLANSQSGKELMILNHELFYQGYLKGLF